MGELIDIIDKTKKYYKFSPKEIRSVIITIAVLAFIISFMAAFAVGVECLLPIIE